MTGAIATTKLNSVGNYDLTFIASSTFGADTMAFEDYIKIVPSTDPMILESVTADKKIHLTYSRDVEFPGTCDPASITLAVTNNGNPISGIAVTGFALNQQFPNIIELTLNQEIYNTDMIKISYNDQLGNLVSADGMKISSFTDQEVVFTTRKDLFAQVGYDGTVENSVNSNWPYAWWGGQWGMYNFDNNVSATRAHQGSKSLYFELHRITSYNVCYTKLLRNCPAIDIDNLIAAVESRSGASCYDRDRRTYTLLWFVLALRNLILLLVRGHDVG